ncbi:hypothetical protein P43SY_004392 [Pythium insidiosum]|uniref:Transmembrane protein n=1 Tax=Pythium insidiosum TaxID=114742 RepID=A0AAD5MHP8_PYTIN|nr:hypothetical protein P43SY_004392 [Pythium insidiosum]KAJ0411823.1 hypothetical protein ATCC90586_002976 [Pythium insidiosum]
MNTEYVSVDNDKPIEVSVSAYHDQAQYQTNDIAVGAWDAKIFGCFDHLVPNCCMVTFLPCVAVAQISHRINLFPYSHVLLAFLAIWVINVVFSTAFVTVVPAVLAHLVSLVMLALALGFSWYLRATVRARFQLPGSAVEDVLLSLCCSCCSVAQMATHVKSYKPGSCDFGPPDTLPAFE